MDKTSLTYCTPDRIIDKQVQMEVLLLKTLKTFVHHGCCCLTVMLMPRSRYLYREYKNGQDFFDIQYSSENKGQTGSQRSFTTKNIRDICIESTQMDKTSLTYSTPQRIKNKQVQREVLLLKTLDIFVQRVHKWTRLL